MLTVFIIYNTFSIDQINSTTGGHKEMKKRLYATIVVLVLLLSATQLFAQYDRDVEAMHNNVRLLGEINSALNAKDFYTTGLRLMELAQNTHSLSQMAPPRGPQAEWTRIQSAITATAFRAIGACGEEDAAKVQAEIGKILALRNEGHGTFR
jgi:hypothetical protein